MATLQSNIQSVGNQVGLSGQQIINAIQSGNCTIANQLASCCCDMKNLVTTQGYENRIATAEQTSFLGAKIDYQTTFLADKFCELEKREMQNKIDALREMNTQKDNVISEARQTQVVGQMIAQATTPIAQAVGALQNDVNGIKCKLPETVTLPYSCATAVPTQAVFNPFSIAAYGLGGCCGGNSLWG